MNQTGLSCIVVIHNKRGLHARAAAEFVKVVSGFDAHISVSCGGQTVSGLSILGLMMLAAGPGCKLELTAEGAEAKAALTAVRAVIEAKYEED